MPERTRTVREANSHPGGPGDDLLDRGGTSEGTALISSGIHMATCPAGLTVGELRRSHADAYEIAPGAVALLDGDQVGDATVVREGQSLTFVARAGEKGMRAFR